MAPLRRSAICSGTPDSRGGDNDIAAGDLYDPTPAVRRAAARGLADSPEAASSLLRCLRLEPEHSVRATLFTALEYQHNETATEGLIELLRSDSAELRSGAVAVLQTRPAEMAPHMEELLRDPDADVRIMALDVLGGMPHQQCPVWLMWLLEHESHPNVLGAALDRLMEIGDGRALPLLARLRERVGDDPCLGFVIDAVYRRIEDSSDG
ncbi:HEAT repeat domain-containing protein [Kushneria aurantia]|uniref:HEAT repeat domain-containing protein n=1 Tax=Kushneria aurantia TaxID=504092 RepID=A0ABV6G779_9GAMM|nr:HEAT repeat domain-containing protein [Kushneria aurantia]